MIYDTREFMRLARYALWTRILEDFSSGSGVDILTLMGPETCGTRVKRYEDQMNRLVRDFEFGATTADLGRRRG